MDRQIAVILESIFGGIAVIFAILWLISFIPIIPSVIGGEPVVILLNLFNIYFWLMIIFIIPAGVFGEIKKSIDRRPVRQIVYVPGQPPQQQQQQLIQVNVPPASQPTQYYATASPPPPQPRPPSIAPRGTIFCSACGAQNRKDARFCKVCGATID